jgi:hypothetical protein
MRLLLLFASVLVLPLAVLLFMQWPLRELVQAYSRQANDLGQILFSLYVAVAVFAASRAGAHLAAGHKESGVQAKPARWRAWAMLLCVGPWALFCLYASFKTVWLSVVGMEQFAETLSHGYFVIKLALQVLLVLVVVNAVMELRRSATLEA